MCLTSSFVRTVAGFFYFRFINFFKIIVSDKILQKNIYPHAVGPSIGPWTKQKPAAHVHGAHASSLRLHSLPGEEKGKINTEYKTP
jgi:hypothetical protein